jgi:NADH:ubiquinone oxidoreductase subunit 6 (subunit J)
MFKLASSIGLALALADLKRRIHYWVRTGILGAVGALFAVFALAFLLVAAHLSLSRLLNPIASAAIIGGVFLLIALILFFIASRPMTKRAPAPAEADSPVASVGDALRDGMARFGSPLFLSAAAALIAGIFLGRRTKRDKD